MIRPFDSIARAPRHGGGAAEVNAAPRSFAAGEPEEALFRFDVARSLRRHRRLALGIALAGLLLAAFYVIWGWRVYAAQCLVFIQPTPSPVLEQAPMHWPYNYDPATYDSYIQQQMLSMTRPDVLAAAAKKLDAATGLGESSDPDRASLLKRMVEVARVGSSYQVAITARASSAQTAAALANAVAASYIENTAHEQEAGDAERLAMLKEERDRIKKELDDDRAEQAALNAQLGVAAIGPEAPEHYDTDIAQIHEALVKARSDHDEAAARLTSMNAGSGASSQALDAEADQLIATDPGLSSLKQALLSRRAALVSQMANLTPNHPQYKQDQAELEKIDASLESSTQQLRAKAAARIEERLRTDLDRTSGLEARLNGELAQMTKAAAGATPKLQRSSDLANDITRLQSRYNTVDEQLQNQTLEDAAPGAAHVAEAAAPPAYPAVAGVLRNAALLFVFFLFLALAAAVLANKMDPRVYAASDVEQLLGYAPMAQLPDFGEVSDAVADEHLLRLASRIDYACKDAQMRSCVFTGTGPGVGVTTVAKGVRDMLAVLGEEAILVDASDPAPAANDQDRAAQAAALITKLDADAAPQRASLTLTDTAPLTVSAGAEYMARRADCTILVIESGATTRAELRAAASSLERLNTAAVGFVLNRVSLSDADQSFRRSVSEVERHLRVRSSTVAQEAQQSPLVPPPTPPVSYAREAPVLATPAPAASPMPFEPRPAPLRMGPEPAPPEGPEARAVPLAPGASAAVIEEAFDKPQPRAAHAGAVLRAIDPVSLSLGPHASHLPVKPVGKPAAEPAAAVVPAAFRETRALAQDLVLTQPADPGPMPAWEPAFEPAAAPQLILVRAAESRLPALPQPQLADPPPSSMAWNAAPLEQPAEEVASWLAEAPRPAQTAPGQPRVARVGAWHSGSARNTDTFRANLASEPAVASTDDAPTRLSDLKGFLFSLGVKNAGQTGAGEQSGNGNGNDKGQVAPASPAPLLSAAPVPVPDPAPPPAAVEPAPPVVLEALAEQPAPAPAAAGEMAARHPAPRWVTAEPEFLPPPRTTAEKNRQAHGNARTSALSKDFDDIQVLPGRRGQY